MPSHPPSTTASSQLSKNKLRPIPSRPSGYWQIKSLTGSRPTHDQTRKRALHALRILVSLAAGRNAALNMPSPCRSCLWLMCRTYAMHEEVTGNRRRKRCIAKRHTRTMTALH